MKETAYHFTTSHRSQYCIQTHYDKEDTCQWQQQQKPIIQRPVLPTARLQNQWCQCPNKCNTDGTMVTLIKSAACQEGITVRKDREQPLCCYYESCLEFCHEKIRAHFHYMCSALCLFNKAKIKIPIYLFDFFI